MLCHGALVRTPTLVYQGVASRYRGLWDWDTVCEVLGSLRAHHMLLEGQLGWHPRHILLASGALDGCESLEELGISRILLLFMHTGTHLSR